MPAESLDQAINRVGNPVEFLRNLQYPAFEFPVKAEFSNWRSEQMAWRETCVLLDQSHHMAGLFVTGSDAHRALASLGVNSFANFKPGMAKQYVCVNATGHFIGDGILFYLEENLFNLVANISIVNWVQFQLKFGGYKVQLEREENSVRRGSNPRHYRYEFQGPNAPAIIEELIGSEFPAVKFFHMTDLQIAGKRVRALRHGMAGQPGFEVFGPWEEGESVLARILEVGSRHGLKRGGARCYATANLESGWIPRPFTAIFGPAERAYREWLSPDALGSLGGSMDSREISDYYVTPYDIGYGKHVRFDHDFLGRAALEEISKKPQRRDKVTLVWNVDDVAGVLRSHLEPGLPAKFMEFPKSRYAFYQVDQVLKDGNPVGMSTDVGYITNERAVISLATVNVGVAKPGTEVTILWGESPNSMKPTVEPHRQVSIRATVAPCPYAQVIRSAYRKD